MPKPAPTISPALRHRIDYVRRQQADADTARSAAATEMRALVLELRHMGMSVRQIGALMGLSGMRISAIARSG